MTSEDSKLPQSLTDADFQAFSLDIAQARADARNSSPDGMKPASEAASEAAPDWASEARENYAASEERCLETHRSGMAMPGGMSQTAESLTVRQASASDFEPIHCNLPIAELMEHALLRAEGVLSDRGSLCIRTLPYGGATAGSYFVVAPGLQPELALERAEAQRAEPFCPGLQPALMDETTFWALYQRAVDYGEDQALYQCDGFVDLGWNRDDQNRNSQPCEIRLICELASQAIMARHWLRSPDPSIKASSAEPLANRSPSRSVAPSIQASVQPGFSSAAGSAAQGETCTTNTRTTSTRLTVIALNGLKGEPCLEPLLDTEVFVAIHPAQRLALVGGSRHGGDLWGAIATLLSEVHNLDSQHSEVQSVCKTSHRPWARPLLLTDAVQCPKAPDPSAHEFSPSAQRTALFLGALGSGKQTLAAALGDHWGRTWQRGPMLLQRQEAEAIASSSQPQHSLRPLLAGSYGNISGLKAGDDLHQQLLFGTVLENVPLREASSQPRFSDLASAVPFRGAWRNRSSAEDDESLDQQLLEQRSPNQPLPNQPLPDQQSSQDEVAPGQAAPSAIFLLVADPAGVLPAIARLTPEQAIYYLTLGYGADLPGWHRHQLHPAAHFRSIDPHRAIQDGLRWQTYLQAAGSQVSDRHVTARQATVTPEIYLLNTGWLGPMAARERSLQQRIPASISQTLVQAALAGELPLSSSGSTQAQSCRDPIFGWTLPLKLQQLPQRWCQPWNVWQTAESWRSAAIALAAQFQTQMDRLVAAGLPEAIAQAGPCLSVNRHSLEGPLTDSELLGNG